MIAVQGCAEKQHLQQCSLQLCEESLHSLIQPLHSTPYCFHRAWSLFRILPILQHSFDVHFYTPLSSFTVYFLSFNPLLSLIYV